MEVPESEIPKLAGALAVIAAMPDTRTHPQSVRDLTWQLELMGLCNYRPTDGGDLVHLTDAGRVAAHLGRSHAAAGSAQKSPRRRNHG